MPSPVRSPASSNNPYRQCARLAGCQPLAQRCRPSHYRYSLTVISLLYCFTVESDRHGWPFGSESAIVVARPRADHPIGTRQSHCDSDPHW